MEIGQKNGAVDGDVAARGRMSGRKAGCPGSGSGDEQMNTAWRG